MNFLGRGCGYEYLSSKVLLARWRTFKEAADGGVFAGSTAAPDDGVRCEWWHPGWLPVASNGGGDYLCVDLAPAEGGVAGQVVHFSHESGERPRLASSFAELLAMLAAHYEERAA
jgi:cell wall assembly regulator SMI1